MTKTMRITWIVLAALCVATSAATAQHAGGSRGSSSRSFYSGSGSYAGSVTRNPDSSRSFSDRNGSFAGSARNNSDGSTSFYDGSGHFTGSSRPR